MRTKKQQQRGTKEVQLSLFDTDMREKSDRELIAELTPHAESVAEDWEWSYNMERLYNQLTPHRRRIAAAAVELYRRREGRKRNATPIRSSADIHQLMCPYVAHLEVEEFWVLPLSQAMRVMQPVRIASGGIDTTVADVRTIMRKLLEVGATNFAIVHNHLHVGDREVHFEFGRSIVGECGELITRVLFNKTTATGRKLLIVDASMTELIRPALYGAYHNIENITADTDRTDKYTVVGTACESTDRFDENVSLRRSKRGDLLSIKSAGAYGMSMASRYNLHDLPRAVYSEDLMK